MEGINFGQLLQDSGGAFEPLPKGNYTVVVDTAEAVQSGTGKLMFKVKFKVVGGPNNGRSVFNNITLTPDNANALKFFFSNMKALGLTADFFASNPHPTVVAQNMVGKSCNIVLDHRPYNGEMRENVKSMTAAVGVSPQGIVPTPGVGPGVPGIPTPAPVPAAVPAVPAPLPPAPAPVAAPAPAPVAEQPVAAPVPAPAPVAPAAPAAIPADEAAAFAAFKAQQEAALAAQAAIAAAEAEAAAPVAPPVPAPAPAPVAAPPAPAAAPGQVPPPAVPF